MPAPLGPTSATVSPGAMSSVIPRRTGGALGPRRAVIEGHPVQADRPAYRRGEVHGIGSIGDRRGGVEQFEESFGRPARLAQLAVDVRHPADRPGHHRHVEERGDEFARRQSPGRDLVRPEDQDPGQGEQGDQRDRRAEERAHAHPPHRHGERRLDAAPVARDLVALAPERLDRPRPGHRLFQHGRRHAERRLILVRQQLQPPPEEDPRQHDRRHRDQDDPRQPPVGVRSPAPARR